MKIYTCMLVLLFANLLVQGYGLSEEDERILRGCLKEVNLSEELVNKLEKLLNFDDSKVKCLHACIIKKRGGLTGGKVTEEKDLLLFFKNFSKENKDKIKQNAVAITDCAEKANEGENECEIIASYLTCGLNIMLPLIDPE